MNLPARVRRLEEAAPSRRRPNVVPTASLTDFARGLITGTFRVADIDTTSCDQMNLLAELNAYFITLSPEHQEWADRSGWGKAEGERWERANLALTPAEFAVLKAFAGAKSSTD